MAVPGISGVARRQPMVKRKEGGGRKAAQIGQALGAVAGGVIGGVTGPAGALAGASAGGGLGAAAGGALGEQFDPASERIVDVNVGGGAQPLQAPRLSQQGEQVRQSLLALQEFDTPFQQQVSLPLVTALVQDIQANNPQFRQQQAQGLGNLQQQQPGPQGLGGLLA